MATARFYLHAFNVGVHDKTALARTDLQRMRLAAETQTNLLARATGPGFMRPGFEYIANAGAAARIKAFVFGATDASLMRFTDQAMQVYVSDAIVTRPAVTAAVTSGDFSASTGWTLTASDGATATVSGGYLNLTAEARGSSATASQTVAVNEQGVEHALRIVVDRGPVVFRCGSASGGDQYIPETTLKTGTHSLSFTPTTSNFYIQFKSDLRPLKRVDSIVVESAGVMSIPTPWPTAALDLIRFDQSADVVFCACRGYPPKRIERRGLRSWSVVNYAPDDGPFTADRTARVRLKSSVTEGNGTLTASAAFFTANHVGATFKLFNEGQVRSYKLAGQNEFTDPIRVTGVKEDYSTDRRWIWSLAGSWVGGAARVWVQRSFDEEDFGYSNFRYRSSESSVSGAAANGDYTQVDDDDNAIIYYRIGFPEGAYVSGVAEISVAYGVGLFGTLTGAGGTGGGTGICRVVGYTSATEVSIEVLKPFSNTNFTERWQEGEWSAARTWPSAVALADGRILWAGEDRFWASVSDAFESFDEDVEGDAGPINRSIATGGINDTQWVVAPQRVLLGTEGSISVAKSSSLDEPITPINLSIRDCATVGAAAVDPARIDGRVLFADAARRALYELVFDGASADYTASQMSKLTTEVFGAGIRSLAVQRRPDTRVWVVLDDGTCVSVLYEPNDEVLAFIPVETDGDFQSIAVLPDTVQDRVYAIIKRVVGGNDVYYLEKMAVDTAVQPGDQCYVMDSYKAGTNGPASVTCAVGTHLTGRSVVVWADGEPVETSPGVPATFTVDGSGNITLPSAVTKWVAGLSYEMRYKSSRLAYGIEGGTAMLTRKAVDQVGLIMADVARSGVFIGQDFDTMWPLPLKVDGSLSPTVTQGVAPDEMPIPFGGRWDSDARVCVKMQSPYTATILGMVIQMQATNG